MSQISFKNRSFLMIHARPKSSKTILSLAIIAVFFTSAFPRSAGAAYAGMTLTRPAEFRNFLPVAKERARKVIYVTVTAYSSTPDQTDDTPFIAASGKRVHDGMAAANFLRFGTRVRFPDYFGAKDFVIEDRMHERFSDRMDVWMPTREEAKQFGIRRLKVEIY